MITSFGSGSKQYLKTMHYDLSLNLLANLAQLFGGECEGTSNRPWGSEGGVAKRDTSTQGSGET